ncbi:MAG: carboxypeptidase regulatory-like domain-containing protein [Acidobacteria bacterium]|nr:carboxypeptidase regulatory-like domain-containing protein [Acidobacteriota bacterium]
MVFDRALTLAEIQAVVNAGSSGICKPTAAAPPSGLVAWWGGDGDARDQTQYDHDGVQAYGPFYSVGKVGQAFNFDGVAGHYVEVAGNGAPFDPGTAEFSVDLWMRSRNSGANTYLVGKSLPDSGEGWDIRLNDNMIRLVGVNGWGFNLDSDASVTPNTWHHIAMSSTTSQVSLYIDGVLKGTCPRSSIIATANPLRFGHTTNYGGPAFDGQMDEIDFFNRAITPAEVTSIYNAGLAGKLRTEYTPANTLAEPRGTTRQRTFDVPGIQLGDATLTLPVILTDGVTQQIPLDPAKLPPLPMGATPTNLTYDIATSAIWSGDPSICFNLPALSSVYRNLRILHLENGIWVNRTQVPGVNPILCTYGLTSLSPFTIADFGPTAASVSISGRVLTNNGSGVLNAIVQLTDQFGGTRTARTGTFGYYRFDEVPVGENYVISVASKRFVFMPRTIMVMDELDNVDLVAEPEMLE